MSDLRPTIISGVKISDFSFIWFSANHFIKTCKSEPGVFPDFILFKACKHSALVNMPSRFSFPSRFNGFEELFPKNRSLIRQLSQSALEL